MYDTDDTVVALATLAGKSALNIVRVSGPLSLSFYQKLTNSLIAPKPNYCVPKNIYGSFGGGPIDYAMIVFYKGPKSFTGEDGLEIIVHGGIVIVNKVIDTIISFGSRLAGPGEFSYRAYLNNKIDLIQAEAISSIVTAKNNIDSFYYLNSIRGNFSKPIIEHNHKLNDIITLGEHELNFSDEEITKTKSNTFIKLIKGMINSINNIINKSYMTERSSSTIRIAIVGNPNVGKSSLFNILVGKSRSIVTNQKGTTRDTVEVELCIKDTIIKLIDTAGLRLAKNKVEQLGIKRTYNEIEKSQIIIIIDDKDPIKILKLLGDNKNKTKIILVNNKADLKNTLPKQNKTINISCKTSTGISGLSTRLLTAVKELEGGFFESHMFLINERQLALLKRVVECLEESVCVYKKTQDLTIFISYLYNAQKHFNSLVRPNDKDEILNKIFKGFCIGK